MRCLQNKILILIVFLLALDGLMIVLHLLLGHQNPFLNITLEGNLPTFYSAFKLLAIAFLLWHLFVRPAKYRFLPLFTALIFLYAALDELFMIHERICLKYYYIIMPFFYSQDRFTWPWLFSPIIALAVVFLAVFRKKYLPSKAGFFITGLIFFGAAFMMEIIESLIYDLPIAAYANVLEESFENFGASFILVYLLMSIIKNIPSSRYGKVKK